MMIDRPDLFAAALLFAPDYDPAQMAKLVKANLWIVASEADKASYTNMQSCMDSLKAAGAHISDAVWSGQANAEQFATNVSAMIKQGNNVKFSVLKKDTTLPTGVAENALNDHAYTWRIGYTIQSLRDWLFTQKK
jgi:predicted peptidase